eukprot:TRINITY_DN1100_c0_g2_i1.p2 TRINITY_DN1100_c0_g2~~TRINITY_DN1100_c0_g2_i1.p2  ORF type:complete len:136 (-),score=16.65 TRINITY_DN1100_c0_g2_i1:284-691(-)
MRPLPRFGARGAATSARHFFVIISVLAPTLLPYPSTSATRSSRSGSSTQSIIIFRTAPSMSRWDDPPRALSAIAAGLTRGRRNTDVRFAQQAAMLGHVSHLRWRGVVFLLPHHHHCHHQPPSYPCVLPQATEDWG